MTDKSRLGKLKFVAKTGGLKFTDSEDWFNPVDALKTEAMQLRVGQTIRIIHNEKNQVSKIDLITEETTQPKTTSKYTGVERETLIVRQNVLARAVELFVAGKVSEGGLLKQAEALEAWVMRE